MLFLLFMGMFFGYLAVAWGVTLLLVKIAASWGASRRTKIVVAFVSGAIFALIPTWDMIPGQLYFKRLCQTEAGVTIYRAIEGVEGFRQYGGGPGDDAVTKYGYRFIEMERPGVGLLRVTLAADGKAVRQPVSEPISRYAVRETREALDWNVRKVQRLIFDERTGERLGIFNIFYYSGNWLQKDIGWSGFAPCGNELHFYQTFYPGVLKPIR